MKPWTLPGSACAILDGAVAEFLGEMLIDLLHRARFTGFVVEYRWIGGCGFGQDRRSRRGGIVAHRVDEIAGTACAQEMREIQFRAADFAADILFQ